MFIQGVSKNTQSNLALLGKTGWTKKFYLSGGTAAALYLGHRLSYDLDFFSQDHFDQLKLAQQLQDLGKFEQDQEEKDTLLGKLNNIKISFFWYRYPLIDIVQDWYGVSIIGKKDLITMKIDAISSRGTKRDFIDLYFLINQEKINLEMALKFFKKKYASVNYNLGHVLRSLVYFEEAERDDLPRMLVACDWKKIKEFFCHEALKILRI